MLNRVFEWYQLVNPTPTDEVIEHRKTSVGSLVTTILESETHDLLIQSVAGSVFGLDGAFTNESPLVQATVKAIRDHQPAFPEDLTDNALELRVCCALAIGEILVRSTTKSDRGDGLLAASLVSSALGIRPAPRERFLKRILEELHTEAESVLATDAKRMRERGEFPPDSIDKMADVAAIQKGFKAYVAEVQKETAADREELNVLWWMFTAHSSTVGKPISELERPAAALCCGGELANLVQIPSIPSAAQMVARAIKSGGKPTDLKPVALSEMTGSWDHKLASLLIPGNDATQKLIEDYPCLMPVSWLCRRLRDSQFAADWKTEFDRRTGIATSHKISPVQLAIQVFNERIAQRIHKD